MLTHAHTTLTHFITHTYGRPTKTILDTGASCNLIARTFYEETVPAYIKKQEKNVGDTIVGINGQKTSCASNTIYINVNVHNVTLSFKLDVKIVDIPNIELICGLPFLLDNDVILNFKTGTMIIGDHELSIEGWTPATSPNSTALVSNPESNRIESSPVAFNINHELNETQRQEIEQLLCKYRSQFAFSKSELGKCNLVPINIEIEESKVVRQQPYRVSPAQRLVIEEQIDDMLKHGIIRESYSNFASPVVLVKKSDGENRFCVDYRGLNKIVKDVSYPIPRIEDILHALQGAKFFAELDLNSGYWQISIEEKEKYKTAFITSGGLYEFNVLPFGLKTSQSYFQKTMNIVLKDLLFKGVIVYIDNIIIYAQNYNNFLNILQQVLEKLKSANLTLKPAKCNFGSSELNVFGFKVSGSGIQPDENKLHKLDELKTPKNVKGVRALLGFLSYYRKFIPNFSKIALPITDLLRKDRKFCWSDRQQKAFETLVEKLKNPPILRHFSDEPNLITRVYTDASGDALGATLMQGTCQKDLLPILYASRKLTDAEKKYGITQKECLAVVWGLNYFKHFIWGRKFQLATDHQALCWLKANVNTDAKLSRWVLILQSYDFDLAYCKGKHNVIADYCSRNPFAETEEEVKENMKLTEKLDEHIAVYTFSHSTLAQEQQGDEFCTGLKNAILSRNVNSYKGFFLRNNIVYKKDKYFGREVDKLVIPKSLVMNVLYDLHDNSLSGGHLGLYKCLGKFCDRFYYPNIKNVMDNYIKSCQRCQERKTNFSVEELSPISPPILGKRYHVDIVGPFPQSAVHNRYVIVAVESFSKFVIAKPIPRCTTEEVLCFIRNDIIQRYGLFEEIVMDRGTMFTSQRVRNALRDLSIAPRYISSGHAQGNGLVEKNIRTLIDMLSKYVDEDQHVWCSYVGDVTHAYNISRQKSTGTVPYTLFFGREPKIQLDIDLKLPARIPLINESERQAILRQIVEKARFNVVKAQRQQKRQFDKKAKPKNIRINDLVMLYVYKRLTGQSSKLKRVFRGPYRVLRLLGNNNVDIERNERVVRVHKNRLKMYIHRQTL